VSAKDHSRTELMIALLAREVEGLGHVVAGALSPLAAAAALLAQARGPTRADGEANINLLEIGERKRPTVRFPGSFGSAYLYFLVPKVVLFREEHSPRSLVRRVDVISAPGRSPENVYRRGGPKALVTGLARFSFADRFRLESIHPGHDLAEVRAATGFDFDCPPQPPQTPAPTSDELALIRGRIREEVAETYPVFAAGLASRAPMPAALTARSSGR
jgi:glutaconate CoA-transferase subunit B